MLLRTFHVLWRKSDWRHKSNFCFVLVNSLTEWSPPWFCVRAKRLNEIFDRKLKLHGQGRLGQNETLRSNFYFIQTTICHERLLLQNLEAVALMKWSNGVLTFFPPQNFGNPIFYSVSLLKLTISFSSSLRHMNNTSKFNNKRIIQHF